MDKRFSCSQFTRLLFVFVLFAFTLWLGSTTAEAKIIEGMQVGNTQPAVLDKDNPQVQAVMAIQDHYSRALLAMPDVVGTATGLDDKGKPAVVVFMRGYGSRGIPARLEGVPVVVRVTGDFHALKPGQGGGGGNTGGKGGGGFSTTAILTPPVPIGVSTGNENECSAGTIGARVTDGGNYYALSNNHVYALENTAVNYSTNLVFQPGTYDTQCLPSGNMIGELSYYIPINFGGYNTVDAALAEVYRDSNGDLLVDKTTPANGYGIPKSAAVAPAVGASVEKYGRTTQLTVGTITGINATIVVGYGASGSAAFTNQIIVQSGKPFLKAGDSGSLLVTSSGLNPVGLIFAGDSSGKYAVANDINEVLAGLSALTGTTLRIDGK